VACGFFLSMVAKRGSEIGLYDPSARALHVQGLRTVSGPCEAGHDGQLRDQLHLVSRVSTNLWCRTLLRQDAGVSVAHDGAALGLPARPSAATCRFENCPAPEPCDGLLALPSRACARKPTSQLLH
jgi:hypothetical protein